MTAARRNKRSDQADNGRPTSDDPVLTGLRQAEVHYRKTYLFLEQQSAAARRELEQARNDLTHARNAHEALSQQLALQRGELDEERRRTRHQRETVDALAATLNDLHRSFSSGNIFDLILKACLTLTGATRGLYVTTSGTHGPMRVRAAVEVDDYPSSSPSSFITGLCRVALENERVATCNDMSVVPEQPADAESFRNCLVAPVVLRSNLSGVIIVADKAGGDFDEDDANVLLSVGSHAAIAIENTRLQREVQEAYLSIVTLLAETMAARNQQSRRYAESGCRLARAVADRLGLSEHERSIVYYAALLHDIGNIGVSDGVLNKPGPLLDAERELIRAHTQIGHDLLREIPVLDAVAGIVRHHHEGYDGSGYPDGLQGDEIPIAARIVAVVDAYGSMLAPRSYRPALTHDQACEELQRGSGTQFDPHVVEAFLVALDDAQAWAPTSDDDDVEVALPALNLRHTTPPGVMSA
jgi:HD-GYP domain-containing protein (c-di-GMP phosphodiesterase class II)